MNKDLRQFQDELNVLINSHPELNWEERLICLQLATFQVQMLADKAIMQELKEEEECKKPIHSE